MTSLTRVGTDFGVTTRTRLAGLLAVALLAAPAVAQTVEPECSAFQSEPLPLSFDGCAALEKEAEDPAAFMGPDGFRLREYEQLLADFFGQYCHRNPDTGWVPDKRVRDTGPFVSILDDGAWTEPKYGGTHLPVVIWYNRKMIDWLHENRPVSGPERESTAPVPDGAIMVKEMYPAPAALCDRFPPEHLKPPSSTGVAFMVRDSRNAQDGWFWGAWWEGFKPDWPAEQQKNKLLSMGYGLYCLNCHASARDHSTFADLKNVRGEPGTPNVYLSMNFLFENRLRDRAKTDAGTSAAPGESADESRAQGLVASHHVAVLDTTDDPDREAEPLSTYNPSFVAQFPSANPPTRNTVRSMPSQTYDHVWIPGGGLTAASQFVTSDQCIGCHDAGSTGLQYDMTEPDAKREALTNYSPYGSWRTSPMGLAGRDPIFFAQLASETETFHPTRSPEVQDVCFGCHGVQGQRQRAIDRVTAEEDCGEFLRGTVDAVPFPSDLESNPHLPSAPYGGLARDGVACTACHRMALTPDEIEPVKELPQNTCVKKRQELLNPDNKGFARTFTGSYFTGATGEIFGPFTEPKPKPMEHALGIQPVHAASVRSSELCGTCHTVHLPIYGKDGAPLGRVYEQTTYPEWAFSAYRTGTTADGTKLPSGAGTLAESCQGCHMPSADDAKKPFESKIASIQELSNFPASENTLPGEDIDLPVRPGFARHTLVGLNVFLVGMAKQYPDVFGIPTQDPMMGSAGVNPLVFTEQQMLEQAASSTASVSVGSVTNDGKKLTAKVAVASQVGHKFPSGVGFRRAFIDFSVLDAAGKVLWASGRTNAVGVIVDEKGEPVDGELWWTADCSGRLPGTPHQPHYQTIRRQDQAQIYQELVASPAPVPHPRCGPGYTRGGQLTTSFLSICEDVKDNRILPQGYLDKTQRIAIARALGAGDDLAVEAGSTAVGDDPDYKQGGGDSLVYEVELEDLSGQPASVQATLYYQAIPPFYLQDRFCTSKSADTERLYFLAGHLDLDETPADDWKLEVVASEKVPVGTVSAGKTTPVSAASGR